MAKRSSDKIKGKFGKTCFKRWGASGGSPILRAAVTGKPVKGYKVTRV
jgi:hypothetical protein